jgi:hypothetical protein
MYDVENDYYELGQIGPIVYTGSQLIDAYTDIRLLDIRSWDSMRRVLETVYREDVMKANEELAMVSPNMIDACQSIVTTSFDPVASSMITGSTFIYDTADGINIRGGSVPFQQFREKKGVVEDLTHLTEVIRMRCQQMEKEFGEIRVFYSPFTFGDKIKIISKQNHQIISTPNPIGFDRDFTTDAMISDITDVMHQEIVGAEDY